MSDRKGWGILINSRKAHYFIDSRSLCGRWMFFGELEDNQDNHPDNCAECKKRKAALDKKASKQK